MNHPNALELSAQAQEILATEVTDAQRMLARQFLESFAFTSIAVYALSLALGEIAGEATATESALCDAVIRLAAVEATEC